ncbi:MAG: hypothetical protein EZS28_031323, partial [Streblomastix strix]
KTKTMCKIVEDAGHLVLAGARDLQNAFGLAVALLVIPALALLV